ncbi:MAG: ferrochelatase [Actinobacteria bacterium]|nr:ferrochelatase [Actinomycetota bacterium]
MTLAYDALVVVGFGGPEHIDEVVPFLERVTAGRGIPRERLLEVGQHYITLGGVSPINAQNRAFVAALDEALRARGVELPVVLANRNSAPYVPDVLARLAGEGHRRILALATAAYSGYSSCRQYREDLGMALETTGLDLDVRKLAPFYDLPAFSDAVADLAQEALPADLDLAAPSTALLFTTHSIPESAARAAGPDGGAYVRQHLIVADGVAARLSAVAGEQLGWHLVYQSRSGPPGMPWLEPDVNDTLMALAEDEVTDVVLVPIGFLSDHVEVIWDLDTQAQATATEVGIRLVRTPTVGTHPTFVGALADRVVEELRTGSAAPVEGELCAGSCCSNPRGDKASVPGLAPVLS